MSTLILQGNALSETAAHAIAKDLGGELSTATRYCRIRTDKQIDPSQISALRTQHPFDINLLPAGFDAQTVKLLITDMDSTLINIECIDEIADFAGVKAQVLDYSQLNQDVGGEHTIRLVEEKADELYSYTLGAIRDYKLVIESLKDTLMEEYVLSKDAVFALLEERSEMIASQLHGRHANLKLCVEEVAA